jgi:preprotein translocase subunit SecF
MYRLRLVPDGTKISFMKGARAGLIVSALLSFLSVVLFFHPGLVYGIDFAGGIVVEARTQGPADFATMRSALEGAGLTHVQLQQLGTPEAVRIRLGTQAGGDEAQQKAVAIVRQVMAEKFPGSEIRGVEALGATVSDELFRNGMIAMALALVAMLGYIWFRFQWQFGAAAVATLILDVTKTIGFFAVTGLEFNLVSIAAILTIMGFSINDKVVVFDRVRENLRKYKAMPLRQVIDLSINEVLNRTINTSITIFLSSAPLAFFAGGTVQEFAIVMLFGLIVGTSSSIFIAASLLLYMDPPRQHLDPPAAPTGQAAAKATP